MEHAIARIAAFFALLLAGLMTTLPASGAVPMVTVGISDTCALAAAGGVYCWGGNNAGQLGNNTGVDDSFSPVAVVGLNAVGLLEGITAISAGGSNHTCALTRAGTVLCWGNNVFGELGNNSTAISYFPVAVVNTAGNSTLNDITAISSSEAATCALTAAATVFCWGDNSVGQLGVGASAAANIASSSIPVQVVGVGGAGVLSNIVQISSYNDVACALASGGTVTCWGSNENGQLGIGTGAVTQSDSPVAVVGTGGTGVLSGITAISAGDDHVCALTTASTVLCWGGNEYGQLGNNSTTNSSFPVAVVGPGGAGTLRNVTQITSGLDITCALTSAATEYCWGWNAFGQLGNDSAAPASSYPVQVVGLGGNGTLSGLSQIATGATNSCAVNSNGTVQCWGFNLYGELGVPEIVNDSSIPLTVNGPSGTGSLSLSTSSGGAGTEADFFGNGKAAYTVWRPATGYWYSIDGAGGSITGQWGAPTDLPVIGDFDGDGKCDFAVFRPETGFWYIKRSSDEQIEARQWGAATDLPVAGDFDGDGKTDIAVFRPSSGYWYIVQSSSGAVVATQWGGSSDTPVVGDFDGDGKSDVAVFRPSTGYWYIVQSSNGAVVAKQWGASADIPVTGDFDGDGKTDIAVYRPSTGYWYIIQSSNGQVVSRQWGAVSDVPVARDYDGDGKTDIAVWRPSTGYWYVIESSTGQTHAQQWGASTDIPVNSLDR